MYRSSPLNRHLALLLALIALLPATGCIGLTSHLLYFWKGQTVPAEYGDLEGKRVAVVCLSSHSSFGPDTSSEFLAQHVEEILQRNVPKIKVVHHDEVADWTDRNGWNEVDFRDIGRGVKADAVVAIELKSFRIHEGPGLYRGHASVTTTVYDMQDDGKRVFRRSIPDFSFPKNGPVTETTDAKFQRVFLTVMAQQITRYFYEYDFQDDFARDSIVGR